MITPWVLWSNGWWAFYGVLMRFVSCKECCLLLATKLFMEEHFTILFFGCCFFWGPYLRTFTFYKMLLMTGTFLSESFFYCLVESLNCLCQRVHRKQDLVKASVGVFLLLSCSHLRVWEVHEIASSNHSLRLFFFLDFSAPQQLI